MFERGADQLRGDPAALERDRHLGVVDLEDVADAPVVAARELAVDESLEAARRFVVSDLDGKSLAHAPSPAGRCGR